MTLPVHLRIYRFGSGAGFEGAIVGAIEHLELATGAGLRDALLVTHGDHGVEAIDLATGYADGTVAALLDYRLDPGGRERWTRRTLAEHPGGVPADDLRALAAALEPGGTMLAVLADDAAVSTLDQAVTHAGGRTVLDDDVDAATLADVTARLHAAL